MEEIREKCSHCGAVVYVKDRFEFYCYACTGTTKRKKKGEYNYMDLLRMGFNRNNLRNLLIENNIKIKRMNSYNGQCCITQEQVDLIKKKYIEKYGELEND